jgi:hypothetical protein
MRAAIATPATGPITAPAIHAWLGLDEVFAAVFGEGEAVDEVVVDEAPVRETGEDVGVVEEAEL